MSYMTVKEAAAKWQIAERSVQNYCANEKIPDAKRIGGQWLIPFDAKPPLDGRTRAAKEKRSAAGYRFPVFIYSRFYRDCAELTQEERCLLQAQLLHFEGDHMQSILLCNKLLQDTLPVCLEAGVYLTLGIDSFLLGLISKYEEALLRLEKLAAAECDHREDFRLMSAALKFYIDWESSGILDIQPSKLSMEAVWYYQTLNFTSAAISAKAIPLYYLKLLESECLFFEKEGMTPVLYFFLCALGVLQGYDRGREEKDAFLERGVALAVEHNWVPNLHRFYNFSPEKLEKCVKAHGRSYYQELMRAYKTSLNNWNIVHLKETGLNHVGTFTPQQFELLLLISYGYNNKEIALCIGASEGSASKQIKELMRLSKTVNKKQLRDYAKGFFNAQESSDKSLKSIF